MPKDFYTRQIGALVLLAIAFVAASWAAHRYQIQLAALVEGGGLFGIAGFVVLTAIFVVFVIPLDIVFLIPVGAAVWGAPPTACLSIIGWTMGAAAAFGIARLFGRPVVERLVGMEKVRMVEGRMPQRHLFWVVVALRMLVSVDILSYGLGLFSDMAWSRYIAATALGVAPFAFFFAYAGTLPFWYQLGAIAAALLLATAIVLRYGMRRRP